MSMIFGLLPDDPEPSDHQSPNEALEPTRLHQHVPLMP